MNFYSFIFAWLFNLIFATLFCHSVLRQNCEVLEKEYFAQFMTLRFEKCDEFEEFNFSVAVHCDKVTNLHMALKEVPLETDWLCLTDYRGVTLETEAFSQFTSLNALYIKAWDVEFQPGTFSGLSQLTTLWISGTSDGNNMTFLKDTFYGLNSLQELKISFIQLSAFNFSLFKHLPLLDRLILNYNNITNLSEVTTLLGTFKYLKKLSVINNKINELTIADCLTSENPERYGQFVDFNISHLDLGTNTLASIEPMSLCNFPHLEVFAVERSGIKIEDLFESGIKTIKTILFRSNPLDLSICAVASHFKTDELLFMFSYIDNMDVFKSSCKGLKKLNLSGNDLEKIEVKKMQKLYDLLELDLSNNEIESLKICKNESLPRMKLVYLNVSFNYLLRLQKGQFACLNELKSLSLDNNKINHIEDLTFDNLDQLELLDLQYNNIFKVSESTFSNLFSVKHLNLYNNLVKTIDAEAFKDLLVLQDIRLTYNVVVDLYWWHYIARSVRNISVKTDILELRDYFLNAFPFLESLNIDSSSVILDCATLSEVKELHLKNIIYFENTDSPASPLGNFPKLEKLYYSGNPEDAVNFSAIIYSLKDVPSLKFLYVHDTDKIVKYNQINIGTIFQRLSHLKVLHLKNSGIDHLDSKDIFNDLHDLEFLHIENQNIQDLESTVFDSMPNLKYIYFLQTTFPCNCKFKGLLSWLESNTRVSIIGFYHQDCLINHISTNLIFFLNNNCQSDLDFIMFLLSFMCTLLFICITLLYESICWYILYIFYTIKCWLNHRLQHKGNYEYDAFVSYNTNNELWVTEQLLSNLEQNGPPFFKVCIHNRDFEIGRDIVENIMDSIYNSRWTICIISHSYLQSNWCSLEMRMATYRLLTESKDSIILILLDKITDEEVQYYYRLTKLLDKKTYLEWPDDEKGQQLFWARLRKVIAKSGRKLKQETL